MLGHEGRKCRTEIRLHGFVNTQNGQIHTWQAPVILRVIIPVHGRFIRITIFIGRRAICLQPRIDILSLLLSLFFHGNNCQNVLIFLSLSLFFFINWRRTLHYHYSSSKLIGVICYTDLCFSRFGMKLKKKKKKRWYTIISKLIIFIWKHVGEKKERNFCSI